MGTIGKFGMSMLALIAFVLFVVSSGSMAFIDHDEEISLKQASRNALYLGINKGATRIDEEISINPEITKEALIRTYVSNNANYSEDTMLNIQYIQSKPAVIAVEALQDYTAPLDTYLTKKGETTGKQKVKEKEVVIFEATNLVSK